MSNSPYTTNRILEIPQDIKLELSNGTLTLKAGSKVYVPNGSGNFDVITMTRDYAADTSAYSGLYALAVVNGNPVGVTIITNTVSGDTAPASPVSLQGWYDTTNNLVKRYNNGWQTQIHSFPLAICTSNGTQITSIDQVFNGFGYIGSTVFALPGVKGLVPNGRNEDGTLKTIEAVLTAVQQTSVNPSNGDFSIRIGNNYIAVGVFVYDGDTNYNYNQTVSPSNIRYQFKAGTVNYLSGRITSLKPYTVDSVVNSNEFYQLKDKAVTTDTTQTISGSKHFTTPSGSGMSIELVADTNQQTIPSVAGLRQLGLYRNATHTKGDGYTSWIQAGRGSDGWTFTELYARRFLEGDSQEILNYLRVNVTPAGVPTSYTRTPPASVSGEEIVTAEWVNAKLKEGVFANTDASNFTATGKQNVVGWGMPNWNARISIATNYTFSKKGWLLVWQYTLRNVATYLNGVEILRTDGGHDYLGANHNNIFIPVDVGDTLTGSITGAIFIPCKGV